MCKTNRFDTEWYQKAKRPNVRPYKKDKYKYKYEEDYA
jgi:hypothetical protein